MGRTSKKWLPEQFRFRTYMDVSENSGFSPPIIHFYRVFHYKPYILGYPYCWKHPYLGGVFSNMFYFHPYLGEDVQFDQDFFQMGGSTTNFPFFSGLPHALRTAGHERPECRLRHAEPRTGPACGGNWEHISPWWWRIKRIQRAMGQMYLIH